MAVLAAENVSGPIGLEEAAAMPQPPVIPLPPLIQLMRFNRRQVEFVFRARRELGDVFAMRTHEPAGQIVTGLPDDVRSLLTAKPEQAPSLTAESSLGPLIGPNSVLTSIGERHMRQRKLLLPRFHGDAIERYTETIAEVAEREIDAWPLRQAFALAPRMQAITLDVIMAGIFGIEGRAQQGTAEHRVRSAVRRLSDFSMSP
ncbi:MAG TPA: cytochrome P450, partial [Solirubrobacteraceae bacterium]|nr:cytochrome P450 [Solirubrobacteraceae bacterium]